MVLLLVAVGFTKVSFAQQEQKEKIEKSTEVLRDFSKMKESIPARLLNEAQGIIIIPNMIKAGLGVGGQRGKGVAMVKTADGTWSDPAFVTITGGSIGFQAGITSTDLVLLFKDRATLTNIGNTAVTLGGAVSVAAGPVGRTATAGTNANFDAQVYSYSRSKGLFAGISLNGNSISFDEDANRAFYSSDVTASSVLAGSGKASSPGVKELKETLRGMK